MLVFVLTVIIMGLVVTAMAVGVLAGREPIKGSCGGLGAIGINQSCEICGGDPARCDEEKGEAAKAGEASFYDAASSDTGRR
jgi:hypothetical protein